MKITGTKHWPWRAINQHGLMLDVLVQSRRDAKAACAQRMRSIKRTLKVKRLLRKLLKRRERAPRVMITDKLAKLPRGKEGSAASGRAPPAQGPEQPDRNRAPAYQSAR